MRSIESASAVWTPTCFAPAIPGRAGCICRLEAGGHLAAPIGFTGRLTRWSVRHGPPRIGREGRVVDRTAQKIDRHLERLVVLRINRDISLRAGLFVALGLEVVAQRGLAFGVS